MDRTQMDQYHAILENIEENLPYLDVDALNKNMNGDAQGKKETQGSLMSPNAFLRTMD